MTFDHKVSNHSLYGHGTDLDLREGGPPAHAGQRREQALALRTACLDWLPCGGLLARLADPLARWWLRRSASPLVGEIDAIARTLGRLVEVTRQRGAAGEFLSVTWPGFAGVLTAVAPGRFAASINQAPMRRRMSLGWLLWLDYALNALAAFVTTGQPPPEHVLRRAFETCATFDEACRLLAREPVARPVLFLVTGCAAGERMLIERDGGQTRLYRDDTVAANAWRDPSSPGWRPRVCGEGTPLENNRRRVTALAACTGAHPPNLEWVTAPVMNSCTRVAVEMCAASGRLVVAGWEAAGRVTAVTEVSGSS